MIHIVDYGMGNLRSVQKAFERLGVAASIADRPNLVQDAEALVLPGVGAFADAMSALQKQDLIEPIREHIAADRPFLGICLGLQLLFDVSFEGGEYEGLGIVPGKVVRFASAPGLRIPHMGWNTLSYARSHEIFSEIEEGSHFYFVHSYHAVPDDEAVVVARSDHGGDFVAAISRGNLVATQFHPEKSQNNGKRLFENFARSSGQLSCAVTGR